MGFPSEGAEATYRNPMSSVQRFFNTRHKGKYLIYNVCSEKHYPNSREYLSQKIIVIRHVEVEVM